MFKKILFVLIVTTTLLQGGGIMAYESIYQRTPVGEFEIKTIPAGKVLCANDNSPYFDKSGALFMRLFRYINKENIAMTVPVEADINPGEMRFHAGKESGEKMPESTNEVKVVERPSKLVAALGIRGSYNKTNYLNAKKELEDWLTKNPDYIADGPAYMSYWNGPMVPFFLKFSEVLIPVKKRTAKVTDLKLNTLTPEEQHVIIKKGTEPPFAGKYTDEFKHGIYLCRQCDAPLYRSDDKFKTECGWPGFDDELPGAIKRITDADGRRTEITCARCGGHLGHVFNGEALTPKDTRHCVNSISMSFEPSGSGRYQRAIFAGGCFWGVEYWMKKTPGVLMVTSGYTGGGKKYPSYQEVCSGKTGHAEAVEVIYDAKKTDYESLAKMFLETHDSTQLNHQGPDYGSQYRSAIFYLDDGQRQIAEKLIKTLKDKNINSVTAIEPATRFWPAEDYHQNYYARKGSAPYCHAYVKQF
jgi:peptide methionine sulfoxide reductase msrA/msrB